MGTLPDTVAEGKARYDRKTLWLKQYKQLRALKEDRDRNQVPAQAQLSLFDGKVKRVLDEIGIWTDLHHQYLSYARALDKSQRTMVFMVDLVREHQILRDRFERRGLDPSVLDVLDQSLIFRTADG